MTAITSKSSRLNRHNAFGMLAAVLCATGIVTATPAFSALPPVDLYGDPAPLNAATRTIVIKPDTKWVNVEGGEVIKFVVGDKTFAWNFFVGWKVSSFDLNHVAPPGMLQRRVVAYVSPDPRFRGP